MSKIPQPTPIFRIVHIGNLKTLLRRGGLHAPNHTPSDGLPYRTIHHESIQERRQGKAIPCGPGGTVHDYVPFYFGFLSPMLLVLKSGGVDGYNEGQEPLIYIVSTVQAINQAGLDFVFSDGHGVVAYTSWFDDLGDLGNVDWDMVYQQYWADNVNDMDRKRRKQAEFLVHESCPWEQVVEIGTFNAHMKSRVEYEIQQFDPGLGKTVNIRRNWYY